MATTTEDLDTFIAREREGELDYEMIATLRLLPLGGVFPGVFAMRNVDIRVIKIVETISAKQWPWPTTHE